MKMNKECSDTVCDDKGGKCNGAYCMRIFLFLAHVILNFNTSQSIIYIYRWRSGAPGRLRSQARTPWKQQQVVVGKEAVAVWAG